MGQVDTATIIFRYEGDPTTEESETKPAGTRYELGQLEFRREKHWRVSYVNNDSPAVGDQQTTQHVYLVEHSSDK